MEFELSFFLTTGKDESGNHSLQEKLEKYLILMTKVVSSIFSKWEVSVYISEGVNGLFAKILHTYF